MPATSHPTDQPTGQIITDEKSLERLFRERYANLIADAKRRLGAEHGAAAPRVVSKAFHLAWADRKRFHSAEELDAFLGANIQHGSARELSRIAGLHRIDAAAGQHKEVKHDVAEMTVDEAWDRLHQTLSGASANEAQRARASTARHEAAEHVAALGKERSWTKVIIIGSVFALLALAGVWYFNKAGQSRAIDRALAAGDVRGYETGSGQQANVTLDDGTVVRLGPESKVTVPRKFGMTDGFRAVRIDGTANFEVGAAALRQPFEVRNGRTAVVARGTAFTVRRYKDDTSLVVYVRDGNVDVVVRRENGEERRNVAQGASLAVDSVGTITVPGTERLDEVRTWVDGNVTIAGQTLRYILPQLKRWYGLDVKVPNATLLDRKVFLRAPLNSPKEALSSIEQSGGLKFTYIGENMAFEDTVRSATKAPARGARRR